MGGSISLDRRLLEWEWHDEPLTGWLWVSLLLMANHHAKKWHGITIERGQLITTLPKLSEQTGLTEWQVRKRLSDLTKCECITVNATHQYSLITICKYDSYQQRWGESPQTNHSQTTDESQTNHSQTTTNNNDNNIISTHNSARAYEGEDAYFQEAFESQSWREAICMKHHLSTEQLQTKWDDFRLHCRASDKAHECSRDIREHFNLWLISNTNNNGNTTSGYISRDEQRKKEQEQRLNGYADVIKAMQNGAYEVQDPTSIDY